MVQNIDLLNIKQEKSSNYSKNPLNNGNNRRPKKILKLLTYGIIIAIIVLFVFTSRIIMSEDNSIVNTFSFLNQIKHLSRNLY